MPNADITLPLDIDGEVVTVELAVEYEYTKGCRGNWDNPSDPPELELCCARVIRTMRHWQDVQNHVNRRVAAGWPELERRLIEAAQETFEE